MSALPRKIASYSTILLMVVSAMTVLGEETITDEANCRNAVRKTPGLYESVYVCQWEMPLEKHLFEIVSDAESQAKYIPNEEERFPVVLIQANITDEWMVETSFDRLTDQQISTVTQIILRAPNLQSIAEKTFSRLTNLKSLRIKDAQSLFEVNLVDTFCYINNLMTLVLEETNISCNCEISQAMESLKQCVVGGSELDESSLDVEFSCVNDTELMPISNYYCVEENMQESTDNASPWGVKEEKRKAGEGKPNVKQSSQATFVLIIIISCVLLSVIVFAVVLFLSHHYCRKKGSKKHPNALGTSAHATGIAGGDKQSHNVSCSPPSSSSNSKQVKFRPLSREYQSIDGCPFDTQLPISSPVHEQQQSQKSKNAIPYSTPEQKEAESWSNSEEFVC